MMVCEQGPAYTQRRGALPAPPRPGSASIEGHPNPHTALQLPRWLLCEPGLEVSRNGPWSQPAVPGRGWTWSLAWPVCASPGSSPRGAGSSCLFPLGPISSLPVLWLTLPCLSLNPVVEHTPFSTVDLPHSQLGHRWLALSSLPFHFSQRPEALLP